MYVNKPQLVNKKKSRKLRIRKVVNTTLFEPLIFLREEQNCIVMALKC